MIIKSMSRKEPSFEQLYDYITRDDAFDQHYGFNHNFTSQNRDDVLREFYKNASLLTNRKNGNYLYHEIISISRSKQISEDKQKQILQQLVFQYAQSRAKDCLVFGGLHDEKDNNLHFHLMISANKLNQNTRYRLSQAQFDSTKKGLEKYCLERYPELEQAHLISKPNEFADNKKSLIDHFEKNAKKSKNQTDFLQAMEDDGFIYYKRGQTDGFKIASTGKKHRLKTLGLSDVFDKVGQNYNKDTNYEKPHQTGKDKKNGRSDTVENRDSIKSTFDQNKKENALHDDRKNTHSKKSKFSSNPSTLKRTVDEFVFGNFTELDKETTKAKYRKQNERDAKVVKEEDRTFRDKLDETAKEWLQGDFSHREARARNKKSEEKLKKWRDKMDDLKEEKSYKKEQEEDQGKPSKGK